MAVYQLITALFFAFALALARVQLTTCHVLKGSVTCLDCDRHYDLSGIKVLVKCSQVKKLGMATTEADGSFETELPTSAPSSNCLARILGGPDQLYTSKKKMDSSIVKPHESASYTISKTLTFYTSCPLAQKDGKCGATNMDIGSSKTFNLPLPKEWGLAPSSYYIPFFPIIGIP